MMHASKRGRVDMLELLKKGGANVRAYDRVCCFCLFVRLCVLILFRRTARMR